MSIEPFQLITNGTLTIGALLVIAFLVVAASYPGKRRSSLIFRLACVMLATLSALLISPLHGFKGMMQPAINLMHMCGPILFLGFTVLAVSYLVGQVIKDPRSLLDRGKICVLAGSILLFLMAIFFETAMKGLPNVSPPGSLTSPGNVTF